ncbi:MAG: thiamine pyrophosphate-binding protein [Myxococcota bacterium]
MAEHLAHALVQAGIRTGFGIPGGETLTLLEALRAAGIRFVLTRHETGAGLLAEGLHHVTGAPGLLVATVGPGVANCPNAVAQAKLDRVPLIVITGNVADHHGVAFTHQVFDQRALLAPLVKESYRLTAATAARDIEEGLWRAREGRPGPVHFDLPLDVAEAPGAPITPLRRQVAIPKASTLDRAAKRLSRAERPLVMVGLEAMRSPHFLSLVERLRAPVLGTYKAIGAMPHSHPLWVSAAGLSPKADALLLPMVAEADVVLLAGYDAVEMRSGWLEPFKTSTTVIDVSVSSERPPEHRTDLRLVGPIDATFNALLGRIERSSSMWTGASVRQALAVAFPAEDGPGPAGLITAIRDAVTPETVVTVDTGAHRILLSQMWRAEQPGTLLQSSGLCTMGYAVPVAIGAALGSGAPTVAVVGDGGFEMALGELATARDLGVNLTIVVIDDRSLALIEKKQRERGLPNVGVDFGRADVTGTDYVGLARAFGATAERFDDPRELRDWLRTPMSGLRLAWCPIERRGYEGRL